MQLKWPGFNDEGTVIIELALETFGQLKPSINIAGDVFTAKDELHITLIGTGLGSILLDQVNHDRSVDILLKKTFESIDCSFSKSGPVHLLSRNQGSTVEQTIIMLLEMPCMAEFYQQLKNLGLIDPATPVPPAHVTMYTHNCPHGIGVPDDNVLKQLTAKTLSVNMFE